MKQKSSFKDVDATNSERGDEKNAITLYPLDVYLETKNCGNVPNHDFCSGVCKKTCDHLKKTTNAGQASFARECACIPPVETMNILHPPAWCFSAAEEEEEEASLRR